MRTILVVFALTLFFASIPGHAAEPKLTGTLALGGANIGVRFAGDSAETAFGTELKLKLKNAIGPIDLRFAVRHFFHENSFWRGKSRWKAGFDVPLTDSASFFTTIERSYRKDVDWVWAGVTLKFGN